MVRTGVADDDEAHRITRQAICIAPSRELAIQILEVVRRMGEYTPVECFFAGKDSVKRGMPKVTAQIIIGTPGTVIDASPLHCRLRPDPSLS